MRKSQIVNGFALLAASLLMSAQLGYSQGKMTMSSGYFVESGGTSTTPVYLVVGNKATAAIARTGGWIISEGEFNEMRWFIDNGTGLYTVPFGYGTTSYLPVVINISSPGSGNGGSGYINFSTYHTQDLNTADMPSGGYGDPPNLQPAFGPGHPSPSDNSYEVVDRFWFIDARSNSQYSPVPTLSNVQLNYINSGANTEVGNANLPWLVETNLFTQRYNPTVGKGWGDWTGSGGQDFGLGSDGSGTVTAANFYRVWTLTNSTSPLPIQISAFTGQCNNGTAFIQWTSQTELNNDYYTIKKTMDNVHFETVGTVKGAGTSSLANNYSLTDNSPFGGNSYYILYQTDIDGNTTMVQSIPFAGCEAPAATSFNAYNTTNFVEVQINSVSDDNYEISLINLLGQTVVHESHSVVLGNNEVKVNNNFSPGVYVLSVKNNKYNFTKKLVIGVK